MASSYLRRIGRTASYFKASMSLAENKEERSVLLPYVGATTLACLLPRFLFQPLGAISGFVRYLLKPDHRRSVRKAQWVSSRESIGGVALELRTLQAFGNYMRYWIETLAISSFDSEMFVHNVSAEGWENLDIWTSGQSGILLVGAHVGSFDWEASYLAARNEPVVSVVGTTTPPVLERWFSMSRDIRGLGSIPMKGQVVKDIIQQLKNGKLVALLSDFDVSGTGIEVNFFSGKMKFSAGAAVISLKTGYPIVPVGFFMEPFGRHKLVALDLIRPEDAVGTTLSERIRYITQQIATAMEQLIESHPTQWHFGSELRGPVAKAN